MTRPSGARWSSPSRRSAIQARSVASKSALEPVRRGLVGAEDAEVGLAGVGAHDVAQPAAEHARGLAARRARARRPRPRSRGSRAATGRAAAAPPLACGLAPMRRSPSGASAAISAASAAALVEQLLRAVGAHPRLERREVLGVLGQLRQRHLVGAEGALHRQAVDLLGPRPALGRAQDDHRPARPLAWPPSRARAWIAAMSSSTWSSVSAMSWCIVAGSSPSTK